jgi:hypothetical protein
MVLVTPEKLRTFVLDHYSRDYLTFETILNNLRAWTISRTYSSTGALDAESFSVNNIGSVPTPALASVRVIWCGKVGIVGLPSIYWYLISVVNTEAS